MEINSLSDFLKSMPDNITTTIQKARYLYLELGKRSFYDSNYKYAMFDEEDSYAIYSSKLYSNPNIIICTTLAKQLVELYHISGIRAELIEKEGHNFVKFYDEKGNEHEADLTNDLKNIQFGCRTQYFCTETVNKESIEEVDLEVGYITSSKSYTDDYWYAVRDIVQSSNLSQKRKLEIVLENLQKFGDITKPRRYRNI